MGDTLQTNISIDFNNSSGYLMWERDSGRSVSNDSEVYLRLYPKAPEKLIVTSGSLSRSGADEAIKDQYIIFNGTSEQSVEYADISSLVIQKVGSFYDIDGATIQVTITYDAVRGALRSSAPCYGVAHIVYKAPYQLYLYTFSGGPCSVAYLNGEYTSSGGYDTAVVVAINVSDNISASLQLTPDECGSNVFSVLSGRSAGPANLVLEVHKDFPPRLTGYDGMGMGMGCKVRQIPDTMTNIDLSSGSYSIEQFTGASTPRGRDDDIGSVSNYVATDTEIVSDVVTYNVSSSAKLKYQPFGSVRVVSADPFLDKWGNTVSPMFAMPGDSIIDVEWIKEGVYTNPQRRIVGSDEIVAITSGNKTVDVYGFVKLQYTIKFTVYDIAFSQVGYGSSNSGWENIHMVAEYDGETTYLFIEAPSIKEI